GEIGRQLLRQHGKDRAGGVHRGRVALGVAVDRRALLYQRVDVGGCHENAPLLPREPLGPPGPGEGPPVLLVVGCPEPGGAGRAPRRRARGTGRRCGPARAARPAGSPAPGRDRSSPGARAPVARRWEVAAIRAWLILSRGWD